MATFHEAARDIPVAAEADVVVAGGGPGGVMAALAAKASETARPAMLRRAKACYEAFLSAHAAGDAARMKAALALQKVGARLGPVHAAPRTAGTGEPSSVVAASAPPPPVAGGQGWQVLFNGRDLAGWLEAGSREPGAWRVEDGCLVRAGLREGYLWTGGEYRDFVLELDYKLTAKGDAGVFLRVGDANNPVQTGMEVQINDLASSPPHDRDCGGLVMLAAPARAAFKEAGQWNHLLVACKGSAIKVVLNDVTVVEHDLLVLRRGGRGKVRPEGRLGLQGWGGGKVWFRNIRVKRLDR